MGKHDWMKTYLAPLKGRTIKEVGVGDDDFPYFDLDDGTRVEVSRDPEGNGPGFLFGLPVPEPTRR